MTKTKPPPAEKPRHDVALWAATASFFGSLLAVGIVDVTDLDQLAEYLSSILIAAITGGVVYSKERLEDAKKERGN